MKGEKESLSLLLTIKWIIAQTGSTCRDQIRVVPGQGEASLLRYCEGSMLGPKHGVPRLSHRLWGMPCPRSTKAAPS